MPKDAPPNGDAPTGDDTIAEVPVGPRRRVSEMQAKLHRWAVADPGRRFDDLFNLVHDPATLIVAWDWTGCDIGSRTSGCCGWSRRSSRPRPYRYVRNPMYLAGLGVVLGQGLLLGRIVLFLYAAGLFLAFLALVHGYEEPLMKRRYGTAYDDYQRAVPAWWPRLTPWTPARQSPEDVDP
jgi:Phospholipid methyltransferase